MNAGCQPRESWGVTWADYAGIILGIIGNYFESNRLNKNLNDTHLWKLNNGKLYQTRYDELDESDDSSSEIEEIESVELGTSSYESNTTTTSNQGSGVSQRSILNSLRSPRLSDLSKKISICCNFPKGKKRSCNRSKSDPKSVTAAQHVKEHPYEYLIVSCNGNLFCRACREELSLKSSVLMRHVQSTKHGEGKEKLNKRSSSEVEIATALQAHNKQNHTKGESLPVDQQVYRVKVMKAFLLAGIPINKISCFREILEENALRLTDRSHMANLIPFIIEQEKGKLKEQIESKNVSVCFDGTTRLGEALVVVLRFMDNNWKLQQHLVQVKMVAKCMTGEEIAQELIDTLSVNYSISSSRLITAMRDRCSVNNVALRTLKIVYPNLVDIGCIAHTINIAGEHFQIPTLHEFTNL